MWSRFRTPRSSGDAKEMEALAKAFAAPPSFGSCSGGTRRTAFVCCGFRPPPVAGEARSSVGAATSNAATAARRITRFPSSSFHLESLQEARLPRQVTHGGDQPASRFDGDPEDREHG